MTDDTEEASDERPDPGLENGGAPDAATAEDPFAELDEPLEEAVDDLFARLGEPDEDDPFNEMGIEVHPEEPDWNDEEAPPAGAEDFVPEIQEQEPDVDVATGEREAVVDKSRYCESCEYFSDPPEIACSHPGTEIRELVDVDYFTVHACPVVAKRRGYDWYERDE